MADTVPFQPVEYYALDDNHQHQNGKPTLSSVLFKLLIGIGCLFLLFSVWFTLWTFIPVCLEALDNLAQQVGEGQQIPYMTALGRVLYRKWQAVSSTVEMTAADLVSRGYNSLSFMKPALEVATKFIVGPVKDLLLSILLVSAIYWFVFLSAKTYTHVGGGNPGATVRERMVAMLRLLWTWAQEELDNFLTYNGIMLGCAFTFAAIFCLWSLYARLRGCHSDTLFVQPTAESDDLSWKPYTAEPMAGSSSYNQCPLMTLKDLGGWAMQEFGQLFKIHFLSSSLVAEILFNTGPLLNWWTPNDSFWVIFLGLSFALTATIYPLVMIFFVGSYNY